MNSVPLTLAMLASAAIWWFAVLAVFGNRFGIFHWVAVAIATFGVPMLIADSNFQHPRLCGWLTCGWFGIGAVLALVYVIRRRLSRST